MRVVGKCLDDTALGDAAAAAASDHALELDGQRLKARDPTLHLLKLTFCEPIHSRARAVGLVRQTQNVSDCV